MCSLANLQVRLRKEQEEKERKRKEKAEAHLYTIFKVSSRWTVFIFICLSTRSESMNSDMEVHVSCLQVARDEDLSHQIGKDIHFDLVDHDKVRSFRIQKQTPFAQFKVRGRRI